MNDERVLKILLAPHVSEKSTVIAERDRQFVFRVLKSATKPEIKQAVESLFKVEVAAVSTVSVKGKHKRFAQRRGRRPDWKKAYVALKPGFDIDFQRVE